VALGNFIKGIPNLIGVSHATWGNAAEAATNLPLAIVKRLPSASSGRGGGIGIFEQTRSGDALNKTEMVY
jgi:hypothetical protein